MVYTVCSEQISELSVDLESKQKELQSVQQDKTSLEQQLTSLVRRKETLDINKYNTHVQRNDNVL